MIQIRSNGRRRPQSPSQPAPADSRTTVLQWSRL